VIKGKRCSIGIGRMIDSLTIKRDNQ